MKHKILKKHLKEGATLPIYLNFREQKKLRGNALLIKRLIDREPSETEKEYEFCEIGGINTERQQDKVQVLYNWQWWRIMFIDGPEVGFETAVKIAYYQSTFWQKEYKE